MRESAGVWSARVLGRAPSLAPGRPEPDNGCRSRVTCSEELRRPARPRAPTPAAVGHQPRRLRLRPLGRRWPPPAAPPPDRPPPPAGAAAPAASCSVLGAGGALPWVRMFPPAPAAGCRATPPPPPPVVRVQDVPVTVASLGRAAPAPPTSTP